MSDLSEHASELKVGSDYEFFDREEWEELETRYGFAFAEEIPMDASLMYEALAVGSVDVIAAYITDGRIASLDLRSLDDHKGAIPPYDAILIGRPGLCAEQPRVCEVLALLEGTIDEARMREMNRRVDDDHDSPARIAREFLETLPSGGNRPAGTDLR